MYYPRQHHRRGEVEIVKTLRVLVAAVAFLAIAGVAFGQEFSERQEVAVFKLSYYGQPAPPPPPAGVTVEIKGQAGSLTVSLRGTGNEQADQLFQRALGAVDEQIRGTFINLGRFDVIGMSQRLTAGSVDDFVRVLREYKESSAELPEAVLLGQQPFTEADFNELVGGFIVVVPSVSWYDLAALDSGDYRAEIETSFTFIDVQNLTTFGQFFVETSGIEERQEDAVKEAVDRIAAELTFQIRSMEVFQLKTGILEVADGDVILEFGRNMGLRLGDEYAIVSSRVIGTGHVAEDETGVIVIKEVQDEFSVGEVLYANPRPAPGDQLQEIPRFGVDSTAYANMVSGGVSSTFVVGVKGTASRGFYAFRPLAGVEMPINDMLSSSVIPLTAYVGGEYGIYMGRLKLAPSVAVGATGGYYSDPFTEEPDVALTHIGAFAKATANVLVAKSVMVFAEAGFAWWNEVQGSGLPGVETYGGLTIGGGITIK